MSNKEQNLEAIARLTAEAYSLNESIPAQMAQGEDVGESLARLESIEKELRFRKEATARLQKAEQSALNISRKREKLALLEKAKANIDGSFLKALDDCLAAFNRAETARVKLFEKMHDAGFNAVDATPAWVCYQDVGQLARTLAHAGANRQHFMNEIRGKLGDLPAAMDEVIEVERKDLEEMTR